MKLSPYLYLFYEFMSRFNRTYDVSTFMERLPIFLDNMEYIDSINNQNLSFTLGMNEFADLSSEEFQKKYLGLYRSKEASSECSVYQSSGKSLPASVDWRTKNVVSPVKDQGQCGSCWAFACTETAESVYALKNGMLPTLAPQELVDCVKTNYGCSGGMIDNTLSFIIQNGLNEEKDYPYSAKNGVCHGTPTSYKLDKCFDVPEGNELLLKEAVSHGPVVACIEADQRAFQFYRSGVLKKNNCGTNLDHAIQVVGYGEDNGLKYWLVRNSWGKSWGDNGYVRLERTENTRSDGTCGIAMAVSGFYV